MRDTVNTLKRTAHWVNVQKFWKKNFYGKYNGREYRSENIKTRENIPRRRYHQKFVRFSLSFLFLAGWWEKKILYWIYSDFNKRGLGYKIWFFVSWPLSSKNICRELSKWNIVSKLWRKNILWKIKSFLWNHEDL